MNRTGKIARLPHDVREELNRRLRDNVSGPKICKWLNGLPAAKAVCEEFARRSGKEELPINEKHLSEWRRGGFQDWMREQQMLTETREMARWSMQLAGSAGGQSDGAGDLSEGAAVLLSGQLLKVLQGMAFLDGQSGGRGNIPNDSQKENGGRKSDGLSAHVAAPEDGRGPCHRQASSGIPAAGSGGVSAEESCTGTVRELAGGDARATGRMESVVRMLGALGRCLSSVRKGDHNRVRLAQVDRKLAQRDKMIALEREKYDKEQAEIAAQKKAEERKKRAEDRKLRAERKKKISLRGLSSGGRIHWVRGRLFGPEKVIEEREKEIKEKQKELAILKKKLGVEEDESEAGEAENGGSKVENGGVPGSEVVSASGAVVANGKNGRNGGGAAFQQMAVDSGKSARNENGANGREEAGLTQRREEAKAQGSEEFDRDALDRMLEQIKRDLDETRAELIARGEYDPRLTVVRPVTLPAKEGQEKFDEAAHFRSVRRLAEEVAANKAKVFASGRSSKGEGINN